VRISGLWRYPVKSMRGEAVERVQVGKQGLAWDRAFGILDARSGTIVSAKKEARLLEASALMAGDQLAVRLPTGETLLGEGAGVDRALSAWLGRPVRLVRARDHGRGTYEMPADFEDDSSELIRWSGPPGSFVDQSPLHVLTTASLSAMAAERPDLEWEVPRFRPNLLIEAGSAGLPEQGWIGKRLAVAGGVELVVRRACSRCVMTTRAQPGGMSRQLDILRHLSSAHQANLGVLARVAAPGWLERGQTVTLCD
jgi:uncharacterized protein YcbX